MVGGRKFFRAIVEFGGGWVKDLYYGSGFIVERIRRGGVYLRGDDGEDGIDGVGGGVVEI